MLFCQLVNPLPRHTKKHRGLAEANIRGGMRAGDTARGQASSRECNDSRIEAYRCLKEDFSALNGRPWAPSRQDD